MITLQLLLDVQSMRKCAFLARKYGVLYFPEHKKIFTAFMDQVTFPASPLTMHYTHDYTCTHIVHEMLFWKLYFSLVSHLSAAHNLCGRSPLRFSTSMVLYFYRYICSEVQDLCVQHVQVVAPVVLAPGEECNHVHVDEGGGTISSLSTTRSSLLLPSLLSYPLLSPPSFPIYRWQNWRTRTEEGTKLLAKYGLERRR